MRLKGVLIKLSGIKRQALRKARPHRKQLDLSTFGTNICIQGFMYLFPVLCLAKGSARRAFWYVGRYMFYKHKYVFYLLARGLNVALCRGRRPR